MLNASLAQLGKFFSLANSLAPQILYLFEW